PKGFYCLGFFDGHRAWHKAQPAHLIYCPPVLEGAAGHFDASSSGHAARHSVEDIGHNGLILSGSFGPMGSESRSQGGMIRPCILPQLLRGLVLLAVLPPVFSPARFPPVSIINRRGRGCCRVLVDVD